MVEHVRRRDPEKGEALAFLVHLLHFRLDWLLEELLSVCWTCPMCEVVFRPTIMMIVMDVDVLRSCPSCEGLWWGGFRTRTPSWFSSQRVRKEVHCDG